MTQSHWLEERLAAFPYIPIFHFGEGPPPRPLPEANALGRTLARRLNEPAEAALLVTREGTLTATQNAWQFLEELEEMAIEALADARLPDAEGRARAAAIAARSELRLRARIAAYIEPMFADRAPLPSGSASREAPRFCELAYVLMRSLERPWEESTGPKEDRLALSFMSQLERDRLIASARACGFCSDPKGRAPQPPTVPPRETAVAAKPGVKERGAWMGRRLGELDREGVSAFARGVRERLRTPVRVAARLSRDPTSRVRWPASLVSSTLRGLSALPLAELPLRPDPIDHEGDLEYVIASELALRKPVFEQIDRLLGDRMPLSANVARGAPRVCDAGYALMRDMLYFGSELVEPYPGEAAFHALPEPERDRMISLARMTTLWGQLR